ncbi:DUF1996 domain-containing protein [Streptomyces armeniacus]|uniref:DUF1996 domain-containing protein n=1 Tax=Streptomyces armeniacus TaxID=83291 RepID=A0A345XNY1_9ACTN|nr:DUF1996 domain-containing protein [Streptomyces armeniacus]AXK33347.1 DUF1996 domain-containing protein [Streptomyces armeniacus]
MREKAHKRSLRTSRTVAVVSALVLSGGGIAALAANASAGPEDDEGPPRDGRVQVRTVDCPDVGLALGRVPEGAETEVAKGLAELDKQVAGAYGQVSTDDAAPDGALRRLGEQRARTIDGIADSITRGGAQPPRGLDTMNECRMKNDVTTAQPADGDGDGDQSGNEDGGGEGDGGEQQTGPVPEDFVDITTVQPNAPAPEEGENASSGSFTTECGRNENGHFNSDNVIAAPGVANGAHHVHDYVGNVSTDAFSTDESLAAADTTCENGDLSSHYWPVLRSLNGAQDQGQEQDQQDQQDGQEQQGQEQQGQEQQGGQQEQHGGGAGHDDGNVGEVLQPASVSLKFEGSPQGDVTAMPRFLRIITGDAKAFTNGDANANASWSCEGFEDRQLRDRYPLCPEGSEVVRTFSFQSCWDGRNTDSGNHRDHVAFAAEDGSCPEGFTAVPKLVQRITYDVPRGAGAAEDTPFAVDSFPEQLHKPVTDHSDFINVMPEELMDEAVDCINEGRDCG